MAYGIWHQKGFVGLRPILVEPKHLIYCIPVSSGRGQFLSVSKIIAFLFGSAFLEQNFTLGV